MKSMVLEIMIVLIEIERLEVMLKLMSELILIEIFEIIEIVH